MSCQELRAELAVAVLTRQPLDDAATEHLAACPGCHDEYGRLAVLPELLAATRDESLPPVLEAEPALLDRLLAVVRRRRRRRRAFAVGGIAAAAALVGVLVSPVGTSLRSDVAGGGRPSTSAPTSGSPSTGTPSGASTGSTGSSTTPTSAPPVFARGSAVDAATGAGAVVEVRQGAWGSDLEVQMSGVPAGHQCRMYVVDASGNRVSAGSWTIPSGTYPGEGGFHETVKTRPAELVRTEILDDRTGATLVVVPLQRV